MSKTSSTCRTCDSSVALNEWERYPAFDFLFAFLITNLRDFGKQQGIVLADQTDILQAALRDVESKFGDSADELKQTFDQIILESEHVAYEKYLAEESGYGGRVLTAFLKEVFGNDLTADLHQIESEFRKHFHLLDKFFLSLAQGRKSRAGSSFEFFHNALFRKLGYPFEEQTLLSDSKPDFLMPSAAYYQQNPLHSIVFTAKRTLRERWRQITTEGTRGIGLYLATIDQKVSAQQLEHMVGHKIFLVVPEKIRAAAYPDATNVLSFARFFEDHLDPKLKIWKRDGVL